MSEKASRVIDHGDPDGTERGSRNGRSTREHKLYVAPSVLNEATRLAEQGQVSAQLLGPGSREERQNRALGVETPPMAERLSIRLRRRRLQERMSDEGGVRPGSYQGLRFERKNERQTVGVSRQFSCTAGAPGPDLRGDLVEDRHLAPVGGPRDSKIESGVVDRNHEVDVSAVQERDEPPGQAA